MTDEQDFDLAAAGLRADGVELRISLEVLADKLEQALPGCVGVERVGGGLFGRGQRHVRSLRVELDGTRYELGLAHERMQGFRERIVGGISIKREPLDPQAWIAALGDALRTEAQRSARARTALEGLLA